MPPEHKWYYYGVFCKCGAFLPIWEAPKIADKPITLEKREDAFVEIICEVCDSRVPFNSETILQFVESSRSSVRFRPSRG
jgi:hypothetical protein